MRNLDYTFLDVAQNKSFAEELRNLYQNRKLNFLTIPINDKKLRNPSDKDLQKWINNSKGLQSLVQKLNSNKNKGLKSLEKIKTRF